MAFTLTKVGGAVSPGSRYTSLNKVDFDNSYATGGVALTAAQLGLNANDASFNVVVQSKAGYTFHYDHVNQKLIAYVPTAIFTVTYDAASLASVTARDDTLTVTGIAATDVVVGWKAPDAFTAAVAIDEVRVSAANTVIVRLNNPSAGSVDAASGTLTVYVTAANGAAHEVPSTTDLSGLTAVRVTASGKRR